MKFHAALVLSMCLALGAQNAPDTHRTSIPITDAYPDDPALAKVIEPLRAEIKATFGQVIAQCPKGLYRGGNGQENELGYWIADAMRERASALVGAEVKFAYTNTGGIRANLRPGPVKVGDIYEVMPFENELVVAELTGAELVEVIRESLGHRAPEPFSGIWVGADGTQLKVTWSDGSAINPKEVVKFATSDYLLASSAVLRKSRRPFTTGVTQRQVILDRCAALEAQGKPMAAPAGTRLAISPELLQSLKHEK